MKESKIEGEIFKTVVKTNFTLSKQCHYSKDTIQKWIDEFYSNEAPLLGELGMPNDCIVRLANVSHEVKSLKLEGDDLVAEIRILKTPKGKVLKELLDDKVPLSFCSLVAYDKLIGIHAHY